MLSYVYYYKNSIDRNLFTVIKFINSLYLFNLFMYSFLIEKNYVIKFDRVW